MNNKNLKQSTIDGIKILEKKPPQIPINSALSSSLSSSLNHLYNQYLLSTSSDWLLGTHRGMRPTSYPQELKVLTQGFPTHSGHKGLSLLSRSNIIVSPLTHFGI